MLVFHFGLCPLLMSHVTLLEHGPHEILHGLAMRCFKLWNEWKVIQHTTLSFSKSNGFICKHIWWSVLNQYNAWQGSFERICHSVVQIKYMCSVNYSCVIISHVNPMFHYFSITLTSDFLLCLQTRQLDATSSCNIQVCRTDQNFHTFSILSLCLRCIVYATQLCPDTIQDSYMLTGNGQCSCKYYKDMGDCKVFLLHLPKQA